MRRGSLPMRHGGRLFGLFRAKWSFLPSHVALEVQCDVAGDFLPFSELKEGVLPQPCRVGGPMRRGSRPTRRGGGVFAFF